MSAGPLLFVCTGNICRSPMAEYLLRAMLEKEGLAAIEVFSRGVAAPDGQPMSHHAIQELKGLGIDGTPHRARSLTDADVQKAGVILVMTEEHRAIVMGQFPESRKKTFLLKEFAGVPAGSSTEVPDPFGESAEAYRQCRIQIQDALLDLVLKLKSGRKTP